MGLTRHPEGSVRELWSLSFPLMLSSLSAMTMIFADRLLLAHYSIQAHNAAVVATTFGWALIFGWVVLANIAEVFVAQYNGAGMPERLGEPVWQMIWLSIGSCLFFIPIAYFGSHWFYPGDALYERQYFSWMLLFGPFYPLHAALCGFFIGQGKTRLITCLVVIANIVNIALDQLLIFGVDGLMPSLGVEGAAIATSLATLFQTAVLAVIFFNRSNRECHGTGRWRFNLKIFGECVRIGLPNAIFFVSEILAFALYYAMMQGLGEQYITVVGICQNMWILFSFIAEGINKATATIVGNMIGAKRQQLVNGVIMSGVKLNALFFAFLALCLYTCSEFILEQFLPNAHPAFVQDVKVSLEICLLFMSGYMFFEGLRFQFAGVLTAAGDTWFLFAAGSLMAWILLVAPVYLLVVQPKAAVERAFLLCVAYSAVSSLCYLWRIYQGKWRHIVISKELSSSATA